MVQARLRMLIPRQERGGVLGILGDVVRRARSERGCLGSRLYRDTEAANGILLEELWEGEEDMERHLRSSEFLKVLGVLDLSVAPPEIQFEWIERTSGIETVEQAREQSPADAAAGTRGPK